MQTDSIIVQVLVVGVGIFIGYLLISRVMHLLFNHPEMHIWHHAKDLPKERQYGVNFGLSLALWDHLFQTAYVPKDGRDIELGFPEDEDFPVSFIKQITYGFKQQ